jgi:hypothetical protein
MRTVLLMVLATVAAGCQPGHSGDSVDAAAFANCPELTEITPPPTSALHVMPAGKIDPCGTTLPWLGLTADGNTGGYGLVLGQTALYSGVVVTTDQPISAAGTSLHLTNDYRLDFGPQALSGDYHVAVSGPIHIGVAVPPAIVSFQDTTTAFRYAVVQSNTVTFTTP